MSSKTASKLVLLVGLIVLLATSAAFIFLGSYILHLSGNITDLYRSTHVLIPTVFILFIGIVLVFLVLIGFFGCILEKKTLLVIFFTCLFLVFLCEVTALTVGVVYKYKIKASVENQLQNLIKYYNEEISLKYEIDYVQSTFQCCGVTNYTDWERVDNRTFPGSCCPSGKCGSQFGIPLTSLNLNDGNLPYDIGCAAKVEELIKTKFVYIILILISIMVLQFISLVASCFIFGNKMPLEYEPFNNGFHV